MVAQVNLGQLRFRRAGSSPRENEIMNSNYFGSVTTFSKRAVHSLGVLLCVLATSNAFAETQESIGDVSLVLGKAYLKSADKPRQLIRAGTLVHVHDQIETQANGHVHIHFIDNAMVSVRPDSRLEIVRYDFDATKPEDSSIKLNLVEGVTRAISGAGAHAARERFRLNTPIAAIGVRGTDFVVSASGESVRARVKEGAIVMAPFSSECLAANFGPCADNAVELTSDTLQVVQLDGSTPLPQLLPAPDERGPLSREEVEVAQTETDAEEKAVGTGVYLEAVTSRKVTEVASNTVAPPRPPVVIVPDLTPTATVSASTLTSKQLVWGRYKDFAGQGGNERITTTFAIAYADGREVTVGTGKIGQGGYGLFRSESGSQIIKPVDTGLVSFNLNSAQAFYSSNSGVVAMQVNSGDLDIDFGKSRFNTRLGLNSSGTGKVDFSAAGKIDETGIFFNHTDTQSMAGAVSIDGTAAGYFFEKQLIEGSIQGLTLWGAP